MKSLSALATSLVMVALVTMLVLPPTQPEAPGASTTIRVLGQYFTGSIRGVLGTQKEKEKGKK